MMLVLGFKLDDKAIYTWFREDLEPFSSASLSLFKKKTKNNFGRIQHKEHQVQAEDGRVRELQQI
jgi:hypothetical protein